MRPQFEGGAGADNAAEVPAAETEASEITLLRRKYGEAVHPLSTDRFLAASKEYYSRPSWLAREIAQNFVDHNPGKHRGTLAGVTVQFEEVPDAAGMKRVIVTGNWPFHKNTGLTTMHSEKPEEGESAGGNGIGLKQTALVFIRDFGVPRFEVDGEGWRVGYRIIPGQESGLPHNWFVAEEKEGGLRGRNAYVIETDNAAVIEALRELPNIAVGPDNGFLREPNFENEHGAIKWLLPNEKGEPGIGRFFLNGQVMDVAEGPDSRGWHGMRGMTLQLNNVKYGRNMDRPPMYSYLVGMHAEQLLRSMKPEELIAQISESEAIWSAKGNDKWEALELVEKVVRRLSTELRFSRDPEAKKAAEGLKQYFEEKKYLARTESIGAKFEKQLEDEGYTLCPRFFEDIGMPSAMEKLDPARIAAEQNPNASMARYARDRAAEESGIEVAYQKMESLHAEGFARAIKERLEPYTSSVVVKDTEVRIDLSTKVSQALITKISLPGSTDEQRLLSAVRDIAAEGLSNGVFEQAAFLHEQGIATFGIDGRGENAALFVRTIKGKPGVAGGSRFEARLDPKYAAAFKYPGSNTARKPAPDVKASPVALEKEAAPVTDEPSIFETLNKPVNKKLTVAASLATFLAVAGWFGLADRKEQGSSGDVTKKAGGAVTETVRSSGSAWGEYKKWKSDPTRNLVEPVQYPEGRSIEDITSAYNRANVPGARGEAPVEQEVQAPQNADYIEGFEILHEPSEQQRERLGILRDTFYILTGNRVDNQLFLFRGRGAKGINIDREGLGVHEEVINGDFQEALNTFIHEAAHNNPYASGHDNTFQHTTLALSGEGIEKLLTAVDKAANGERLTVDEERLVALRHAWGGS